MQHRAPCLPSKVTCWPTLSCLTGRFSLQQGDEILENEMSRIDAGEKMVGMDTKRYNLDPPPAAKRNDYAAWRQSLDNAYSQLEHQYNRCAPV